MSIDEMKQVLKWNEEGKLQYNNLGTWMDYTCTNLSLREQFSWYRRKPDSKLRPWKPEEVPIGALIKMKKDVNTLPAVILGVYADLDQCGPAVILSRSLIFGSCFFLNDLVSYHGFDKDDQILHSTDFGKTWKPCGVEE